MFFTQPEQRVHTGARRVRLERAVPMKAAAIIAALGIALILTMGPAPASAQTTVIRECGDHYLVTHYNSDGSVKGVHNKQLSAQGTIYTAGKTWLLVEGDNGQPDRFVSDGGVLQVGPCEATRGAGVRQVQGTPTSTTLVSNINQAAVNATGIDFNSDYAQSFRTGSNSGGYRLTSITINMKSTMAPTYTAAIHADSGGGTPNTTAVTNGTLTNPALGTTFTNVEFSASGNGIDLEAGTTYWLVFNGDNANTTTQFTLTVSNTQTGTGWGIGDDRLAGTMATTGWTTSGNPAPNVLRFTVEGYAIVKPALVSAEVNGTSLVLTFSQNLDTTSRTAARQFGIRFGGGGELQRATAISISGRQVTLTVPEVRAGQVVTVSYTVPTRNPLKGSNGWAADAFSDQAVTVNTGPAYGRLPESGKVRDAVYVTYTNADGEEVTVENRAASADRETLLDYYEDACRANPDPRFGTNYLSCASYGLYVRQANCANDDWVDRNPHLLDRYCPTDRTW